MSATGDSLRARLEAEAGSIAWPDLERHFARGALVTVAGDLDLIDVALCMVRDDRTRLEGWMQAGRVGRTTVGDARAWAAGDTTLRAVVVAPWVLVQAPG